MAIDKESKKDRERKNNRDRRDFVQDSKDIKHGFWVKPRPWVFVLLVSMEALNFTMGPPFWYALGISYKDKGWTEAARICMQVANFANPWSEFAKRADAYSKARLPAHPISEEAQQGNIEGFNLDAEGRTDEAIVVFKSLIARYPDFEWPYNNLAGIMLDNNDPEAARVLSSKALQINPYYANAHMTLADALQRCGESEEASKHRAKATELIQASGN